MLKPNELSHAALRVHRDIPKVCFRAGGALHNTICLRQFEERGLRATGMSLNLGRRLDPC
jgi:hypothetical protein